MIYLIAGFYAFENQPKGKSELVEEDGKVEEHIDRWIAFGTKYDEDDWCEMGEDGDETPNGEPTRDGWGFDEDEVVGKGSETKSDSSSNTCEPVLLCKELGGEELKRGELVCRCDLSELMETDKFKLSYSCKDEKGGFDGAECDTGEGKWGMGLFEDGIEGESDTDTCDGHEDDEEGSKYVLRDLGVGDG